MPASNPPSRRARGPRNAYFLFRRSPLSSLRTRAARGPRGLSPRWRPSPRDSKSKISNNNSRGELNRFADRSIVARVVETRVPRVCYEYFGILGTVRGKCSVSLSLIAISIWRHSSPPRVFGNVVSAIRLRPRATGLVIFFKTLFVAVRVMSTIGSNRSDHRWSVA